MATGNPLNDARTELEHEADVARARLLNTIDRLDQRRQEVFDWRLQARRHSVELALAGGALAATIGVPIAVAIYRASTRSQRLRDERVRALTRFWAHPERVAVKRKRTLGWFTSLLLLGAGGAVVAVTARQKLSGSRPARFPAAAPLEPLGR